MPVYTSIDSPVGALTIAAHAGRVCLLHFDADEAYVSALLARWYPHERPERHSDPAGVVPILREYFDGCSGAIDRIDVALHGTAFQQRVWMALRGIPAGTTTTYAALARVIGAPAAVRAVGAANGANPVALIVPCHRVIGADGSLTGYGGGLERKRWLLAHEGALAPREPALF